MNLRDKLNAISSRPKVQPAAPIEARVPECLHVMHLHPPEEFPGAEEVTREALMLMQGDELPEPFDPDRVLYLDTETTGFQGAGTVAFMIGVGFLTPEGFEVHQYVLRDYPEETAQLKELQALLAHYDVLCTFNGRSFDLPLLRTRFLMNRMRPDCLDKPDIDLLHIARRTFKLRLRQCSLGRLEECILGQPRENDLPGSEAPKRFFAMLQTGELHLLDEVLKHNEQDVASMCTLLAHMHRMYTAPESVTHGEDLYAMGLAMERMHHPQEARRCYRLVSSGRLHAQGQLRLAASYRRSGEKDTAAAIWQKMLERREGGAAPYIELAKYYEHTAHDLPTALRMTRQGLALLAEPSLLDTPEQTAQREELQARYARLSKMMQRLRQPGAVRSGSRKD